MRGHIIVATMLSLSVAIAAQTAPVAVYVKPPRTSADPRARLVGDLRDYLVKKAKREVRVVDSAEAAQLVVDVTRPYVTGTPVPYIVSASGDDRVTAAAMYVVGAQVCVTATDMCSTLSASAKLNSMAALQLGEKLKKLAQENAAVSSSNRPR